MQRLYFILSFIFISVASFSQPGKKYVTVDNWVKMFPMQVSSESDMRVFIREMSRVFTGNEERLRAVYFWITENIAYDCEGYHHPDLRSTDINVILKQRKAVCAGYSKLLKFCAGILDIDCEYISGFGRIYSDSLISPESLKSNHAWNAVKLNGEWKLIDPTWGSGYADRKVTRFERQRNDYYFMMQPAQFIYEHFPDSAVWQLLKDTIITKAAFCNQPLVLSGYFENHIKSAEPFVFNIQTKENDSIVFKFYTSDLLNSVSVYSEENKNIFFVDSLQKGSGFYYFKYLVSHPGKYDLMIEPTFNTANIGDTGVVMYRSSPSLQYYLNVAGKKGPSNRKK